MTEREPDHHWMEVIVHPPFAIILENRGSGKLALGRWLPELFRYKLTPYVVGVPAKARRLLSDWIGIAPTLEDLSEGSIALMDEAHLHHHARP